MEEISNYYTTNIFTSADAHGWEDKLSGIPFTITYSMNSNLIKPVDDSEIKRAVFSMNPNKAPRIDGITPLFF